MDWSHTALLPMVYTVLYAHHRQQCGVCVHCTMCTRCIAAYDVRTVQGTAMNKNRLALNHSTVLYSTAESAAVQ